MGPHCRYILHIKDCLHDRLVAPVVRGIVLRHEIVALLGAVEIDAKIRMATQHRGTVSETSDESELRKDEHGALCAKLGKEGSWLAVE